MNLNPFYHWKKYISLTLETEVLRDEVKFLTIQNNTLLRRNEELVADKQALIKQLDECHEPEHQPIIVKHSHRNRKRGK